jgi:multidrug resistance efflux pump
MKQSTAIALFIVVTAATAACGGNEHQPAPQQRQPVAVAASAVRAIDTAERLEAGGVVAALETAAISSRMVASVVDVTVTAGDRVRSGDVLITMDARDVAAHAQQARDGVLASEKALAQARTERAAAEAEHRLAAAWHQRIAALHARKSATDQERDEAEARLNAAAARVAGADATIELAEANVGSARSAAGAAAATESYTTLRAPFNGMITERLVDPGNLAAPGVPLLRIDSDGSHQVVAQVDEARVAFVRTGDRVDVEIGAPGNATEEAPLVGEVAEVARAVGADQRAFTVKVSLPGGVTARSGTFARIVFKGKPRRALVVPASAIRRQGQVASVFVVQDGVARLRLIQAGPPLADGVEVLAGVDAGESVISAPAPDVTDGVAVAVGTRPAGARR